MGIHSPHSMRIGYRKAFATEIIKQRTEPRAQRSLNWKNAKRWEGALIKKTGRTEAVWKMGIITLVVENDSCGFFLLFVVFSMNAPTTVENNTAHDLLYSVSFDLSRAINH